MSPPIKEYRYNGNVELLIKNIKKYIIAHPSVSFKVTGVDGDKDLGFVHEITISFKLDNHDLTYDLNCREKNLTDDKTITNIELVGANDLTNGTGGYGINAIGMDKLVNIFNSYIIYPLQNEENIKITPL